MINIIECQNIIITHLEGIREVTQQNENRKTNFLF